MLPTNPPWIHLILTEGNSAKASLEEGLEIIFAYQAGWETLEQGE